MGGIHRAGLHGLDDLVDLRNRSRGTLGQAAYFIGDHGETASRLAGPGRFDSGVEGQQVGLLGDALDHFQHLADPAAVGFQATDHGRGVGDLATHLGDAVDGALHHLLALLRRLVGIVRGPGGIGGMARDFLGGGGHLVHRRGHLVGAAELVVGALGHQGRNGVELATGSIQVRGTALQAGEGLGKEVAQGIGGGRQLAQLVLASVVHPLGELATAELGHVVDQLADRLHQATVDQPQAEQADQQAGNEHHQDTQPHRAIGGQADLLRLLLALLAQLDHQLAHLLAGGTVEALHRSIAGTRIGTAGHIGITGLLVGLAKGQMLLGQTLDPALERGIQAGDLYQLAKDVLHVALAILELLPVLVHFLGLLASQQHVLPLLHLDLELQVGLVDQLRTVQRAFDQLAVVLHAIGQQLKARQGDQQHRQQAATQQGKNLPPQGFLQKHREDLMAGMEQAR